MKDLTQYTDAEFSAMSPQQQADLAAQYQAAIQQRELQYRQASILDKLDDKDFAEIEKNRPGDVELIHQGKIPPSFIKEETNSKIPFLTRFKLKNIGADFGSESSKYALDAVRNDLKDDFKTIQQDGRIYLQYKKDEDKNWYPLDSDPTLNVPKLVAKLAVTTGAGAMLGLFTGKPLGLFSGAAAGAGIGADLVKDDFKNLDWKKEKNSFYHFFKDIPEDFTDVLWDQAQGVAETAAGTVGAGAGIPLGIPGLTGLAAAAFTAGAMEGAREKLGNMLWDKQKISAADILTSGVSGGGGTFLFGANPTAAYYAKKLGAQAEKIAQKEIPALKKLINPTNANVNPLSMLSDEENKQLLDRGFLGNDPQEISSKIMAAYQDQTNKQFDKSTKGAAPALYDWLTRDATVGVASTIAGVSKEAYLNYYRNPKRMLELDANVGNFAGQLRNDLRSYATETVKKTGVNYEKNLKDNDFIRVDLTPTADLLTNRITTLEAKAQNNQLLGKENEELNNLKDMYENYFMYKGSVSSPQPTQRNLLMSPFDAKEYKNEFNKYAEWNTDLKTLSNPADKMRIQNSRDIYHMVNDLIENGYTNAHPNNPEKVTEYVRLRNKNEIAHQQEDAVKQFFPDDSGGDLIEFQNAWNRLANPNAKSNVVLTDFLNNLDKARGLKGPDSTIQKMNDLYSHQMLGSPGSGGFKGGQTQSAPASIIGSGVAGTARAIGGEGMIGYSLGKLAGMRLIAGKAIMAQTRNVQTAEEFIGKILDLTGRKKIIPASIPLPVSTLQATGAAALANPMVQEQVNSWQGMQPQPNNNDNYIDNLTY